MDSSSSSLNVSFGVVGGEITEKEKRYLIEKGLKWEDSNGDLFDISTDVEDVSLDQSRQHSLILFEENERLYRSLNGNSQNISLTPSKLRESAVLPVENPEVVDNSLEDDEDKENKNVSAESFMNSPCSAWKSQDEVVEEITRSSKRPGLVAASPGLGLSYNEVPLNESTDYDYVGVVPCTQNLSMDGFSNISDVAEDDIDIIPCTQQQESFVEVSQLDVSSVPCSQASGVSKEDLDDTITTMTKLLALADEEEAREKMNSDQIDPRTGENEIEHEQSEQQDKNFDEGLKEDALLKSNVKPEPSVAADPESHLFKTPLKHARVGLLKRKNLYTPSPPRSHVDSMLQRGQMKKLAAVVNQKSGKLAEISPANTSTPKRTPLNNITPMKKTDTTTPKSAKTPVTAKVDSGLRRSPFAVGLSPVANYIYSKPAPSTFQRVAGIPNSNSKATGSNIRPSVTKIPLPPSRASQVQTSTKTPGSSSKEPRTHSVLRTATYFNLNCTPPKIILNEKTDTKRFQPLQYSGAPKVKAVNGIVDSPRDGYVAHRHTGLRDESGNASFIQNAQIQKRNIPAQSRLPGLSHGHGIPRKQ